MNCKNARLKGCLRIFVLATICLFLSKETFAQYDLTKWDSLRCQTPEWYQDAKLGIYPHFGVYSQAAFGNEWYGYSMYDKPHALPNWIPWTYQHHCTTYGNPSTYGYKDLVPLFKAENFNADDLISYVVKSGAKYFAHMTSHHDAFLMYGSKLSRWNCVNMGPKKDIGLMLQAATKKRGLRFGISNHLAENNWFFQTNWTNGFDATTDHSFIDLYNDSIGTIDRLDTPPSDRWCKLWVAISKEMIDYFKPDYIYYDRGWSMHPKWTPYRKDVVLYQYNKAIEWGRGVYGAPNVALLYKDESVTVGGAIYDQEAGVLKSKQDLPFQSDYSISSQWGYVENDNYKSTSEIVNLLVDIVSKNGNLMLSINPKGDGTLPEQTKQRLTELGNWMALNGEGIYASRPAETFGISGENQIRFTRNKDTSAIYVFSSQWLGNDAVLNLAPYNSGKLDKAKISKITLLGNGESELKWSQDATALSINFPSAKPSSCDYCYVFKIYLDKGMKFPARPSNLSTTPDKNGIKLQWVNNSTKATDISIERKDAKTNSYKQIANVKSSLTTFVDLKVSTNETYTYRVRANKAKEYSIYSNESSTQAQ